MECKSILKDTFEYGGARFNRYIVECQSDNSDTKADTGTGFNRYIVECKLDIFAMYGMIEIDLIDT